MSALFARWSLLLLTAGQLVGGHVHNARHGGVIVHHGKEHLEIVVEKDRIKVWLLDGRERAVAPAGRSLRATLTVNAGTEKQVVLEPAGDHLERTLPVTDSDVVVGRFEEKRGGRVRKTAFRWTPLDARGRLDDTSDSTGLFLGR